MGEFARTDSGVHVDELVREELIGTDLAHQSRHEPTSETVQSRKAHAFQEAYRGRSVAFKAALFRARDCVGTLLARSWLSVPADDLSYSTVAGSLLDADCTLPTRDHRATTRSALHWREIGKS